ncbi:chromosomal replication initiator protein DnaA [Limosilactobacillus secaliphilus]|uniref:chromosomal replication initiator protein DnaA n=1 Tax=Limosilactobacillus secaliphilus TaxID=396268 RepID=UPI00070A93A1|nr:chromosomal replication initiator protein DnaA [Limosilactobacillus secaliphilus]
MTELDSLWETVQNAFKQSITIVTYDNVVAPAKAYSLSNGRLTVVVPTDYHLDFWQNKLDVQLKHILKEETGQDIDTRYVLTKDLIGAKPTDNVKKEPTFKETTPLNPEYTFETFVEGRSNQFAYASAYGASEQPGLLYNPLLIYGGVGLGKTHLMQAIANAMLQRNPNAKIKYVTSENFVNDYINSIKTGTQEQFRQAYRDLDALLVDDVQFLSSKNETQLEFFNTFNVLHDNNKQIVLTADQNPKEIPNLTERLVSRFVWGLTVEITPPDLETRIAILNRKADEEHIENVPNEVFNFIASKINTNVRELEGALMRVRVFAQLHSQPMSLSVAKEALQGIGEDASTELNIDLIQKKVAAYFNINQSDITGKKRVKNIVVPRQIAMYLSRELTDNSLPRIGRAFGGKDHTTVLHAIDKIEKQIGQDTQLKNTVDKLQNDLRP